MNDLVQELTLDEGVWATFTALLDGPATTGALADRLNRPIAAVARYLSLLSTKGLIVEDGTNRVGGWLERRYRLPDAALRIRDPLALPLALEEVRRGMRYAELTRLPAHAQLVAVRIDHEDVREILDGMKQLCRSTELRNQPGKGARLGLFAAAWLGDRLIHAPDKRP